MKFRQVLSFDFLKSFARAYISVAGGIDTPASSGICSICPIGGLGGSIECRPTANGDTVTIGRDRGRCRANHSRKITSSA